MQPVVVEMVPGRAWPPLQVVVPISVMKEVVWSARGARGVGLAAAKARRGRMVMRGVNMVARCGFW